MQERHRLAQKPPVGARLRAMWLSRQSAFARERAPTRSGDGGIAARLRAEPDMQERRRLTQKPPVGARSRAMWLSL